jgi:hypothetical protein
MVLLAAGLERRVDHDVQLSWSISDEYWSRESDAGQSKADSNRSE